MALQERTVGVERDEESGEKQRARHDKKLHRVLVQLLVLPSRESDAADHAEEWRCC